MMLGGCGEGPSRIPWDHEGCATRGIVLKAWHTGTSLVVQWLRLHTSNAGGINSSPSWETKIPHAVRHSVKKKKNLAHSGLGGEAEPQKERGRSAESSKARLLFSGPGDLLGLGGWIFLNLLFWEAWDSVLLPHPPVCPFLCKMIIKSCEANFRELVRLKRHASLKVTWSQSTLCKYSAEEVVLNGADHCFPPHNPAHILPLL